MVGLLILKSLENLTDESIVIQWKGNVYYQTFCGMTEFQQSVSCYATELVHIRKRIDNEGVSKNFQMSIALHCKAALGRFLLLYTLHFQHQCRSECRQHWYHCLRKKITYPTDAKLAIKIPQGTLSAFGIHIVINLLIYKFAKNEGIQQRRIFVND